MTQYDLNNDFKEEVRASTNIVDLIGRHVQLRRTGKNYLGLCPFHDDHKPSLNVSPDRQMYKCFACGAGGDVFAFLMNFENMSFPDAVIELAKEAGLKIPERSVSDSALQAERARLVEAHEAALDYYRKNLDDKVVSYLTERGFSRDTIDTFEIGFATETWDGLIETLSDEYDAEELTKAGLAQPSSRDGRPIDRFRNRIMIPIRAAGGRLVAFGGRIFGDGEPKYMNSPETVLFNKSRTLFGLHQGLRSIRKSAFAILVEGYFDAIALHQEGFAQAVAPLGTSLAEDHARLLNRYCSKVVICMDADTAGKRAAVRSAAILLEHGFAVNVIPLPEGEDPDSYIQTNSAEAFRTLIKDSQPAYHYILKLTAEKHDLTRPSGKRKALEELTPLLGRISDPIERSHAVGETSDILDVEQHIVAMELDKQKNRMSTSRERETRHLELISKAEKELLAAAFIDREEAQKAIEDFVVIDYLSPFARVFLEGLLTQSEAGKTPSAPQIADLFSSADEKRLVAELALSGEESRPSAPWESAAAIVINGLTREFEKMGRKMSELQRQQPSSKELESLFAERLSTKQRINELEKAIQSRNFSVKDKKVV